MLTHGVGSGSEVSNGPQEFKRMLLLLQGVCGSITGAQELQLAGLQLHLHICHHFQHVARARPHLQALLALLC